MKTKGKNKKTIASIVLLLIVVLFVVFFTFKSGTLASVEVFNDINFKSKNANVDVHKIDFDITEFRLSDDEKTAILNAFEHSKYEILSDSTNADYNYRVDITLNKRYELWLDSTEKILIFVFEEDNDSNHKYYKFSHDSGLFKLLEEKQVN